MPIRFDAYRMRDGVTPLSQDYFNAVFGDVDARIADLEERRASLQQVTDELTRFGLARIDTLLGPSMAEVAATLAYLYQKRAELEAAVGDIGHLVTTGTLNTALAQEQTARSNAIADEALARSNAIAAEALARTQAIAAAHAPVNTMIVARTGARITGITENGVTTTFGYDGNGRVATISYPRAGKTRTETYSYNGAGQLTGMTAAEA